MDSYTVVVTLPVTAKWTLPSGAWSGKTSRGMRVEVRRGFVSVVLANRFLRAALGTEQYFAASEIAMSVTDDASMGWPRRTWVVLMLDQQGVRPVAVATHGDPQPLVATVAMAGVRQIW